MKSMRMMTTIDVVGFGLFGFARLGLRSRRLAYGPIAARGRPNRSGGSSPPDTGIDQKCKKGAAGNRSALFVYHRVALLRVIKSLSNRLA